MHHLLAVLLALSLSLAASHEHAAASSRTLGARGDTTSPSLRPATAADLPLLGANGSPVLTVDGRQCAFPWTGPDGAPNAACSKLPGDGDTLWCKDAKELWGVCAAPAAKSHARKQPASARLGGGASRDLASPAIGGGEQPDGAMPADGADAAVGPRGAPSFRCSASELTPQR
jgi:hypothetical protein